MERFSTFFEKFKISNGIIEESLKSRVDELTNGGIFSQLGREYIEDMFEEYKARGVIPSEKVSLKASSTGEISTVPLEERDYEEVLPYVFKFVDSSIREKLIEIAKDDEKFKRKIDKHYNGLNLRPALEDASQISGVLTNWFVFRNKGGGVPKSLRSKIDFNELSDKVDESLRKQTTASVSDEQLAEGPDYDIPEGFAFIKEVNGLRLYKWSAMGNVCGLDQLQKQHWMATSVDLAGNSSNQWCVAEDGYASQYGEPSGDDGVFKYPYYMIRKKSGSEYVPYVLLHGNSLQAKDDQDRSIEEEQAEEVYPVIKGMLKTIVFGDIDK